MLSQLRRKRPEVRWEMGRMMPTIDELKARSYPRPIHNSKPLNPIHKRSAKAQKKSTCFPAQVRRPLQVQRAATSARARQDTSTLSVAGDCAPLRARISKVIALTAHRPIYSNQPPLPHPRSMQKQRERLGSATTPRRRRRWHRDGNHRHSDYFLLQRRRGSRPHHR